MGNQSQEGTAAEQQQLQEQEQQQQQQQGEATQVEQRGVEEEQQQQEGGAAAQQQQQQKQQHRAPAQTLPDILTSATDASGASGNSSSSSDSSSSSSSDSSSSSSADGDEGGEQPCWFELDVQTLDRRHFRVRASPEWTTLQLKEALEPQVGFAPEEQRLVSAGHILRDGETLASLGLPSNGASLHLVRNLTLPTQGQQPSSRSFSLGAAGEAAGAAAAPWGGSQTQQEALMQQLMRSPLVQHLLEDTDLVRGLIESNPQLQALRAQNPEIDGLLSDPQLFRLSVDAMRNPALLRELIRSTDRALANIESVPGGFNALTRLYRGVQEPMHDAAMEMAAGLRGQRGSNSSGRSRQTPPEPRTDAGPAKEAMPNPWATQEPQNTSGLLPRRQAPPVQQQQQQQQQQQPVSGPRVQPQLLQTMLRTIQQRQQPDLFGMLGTPAGPSSTDPFAAAAATAAAAAAAPAAAAPALGSEAGAQVPPASLWGRGGLESMPGNFSRLNLAGSPSATEPSTQEQQQQQQQYAQQLESLNAMGFSDQAECLWALQQTGGNINRAIDLLLTRHQ